MEKNLANMKKNFPYIKTSGSMLFFDFSIVDKIKEKNDEELQGVLDKGYGAYGTACRLKVELRRVLENNPASYEQVCAKFADRFGTSCYVTVTCKKTQVYQGCKILYSLVTALDCVVEFFDNEDRPMLERKYKRSVQVPVNAVSSSGGKLEEVFV